MEGRRGLRFRSHLHGRAVRRRVRGRSHVRHRWRRGCADGMGGGRALRRRARRRVGDVLMGFPYLVSNIQATEPEALPKAQGIRVTVEPEHDSMGFNTVTIEATSREVLLAYVREHWGSGDEEWLEEWVDRRIEFAAGELETELMLCLDGAEEISLGLRDGDDAFNSEQERSAFDRAYELKESNPDS